MDASTDTNFELLPRDLRAYCEGNTGIPYVHRFESGKPGPHVLVNALTHGNEFCGMPRRQRSFREMPAQGCRQAGQVPRRQRPFREVRNQGRQARLTSRGHATRGGRLAWGQPPFPYRSILAFCSSVSNAH